MMRAAAGEQGTERKDSQGTRQSQRLTYVQSSSLEQQHLHQRYRKRLIAPKRLRHFLVLSWDVGKERAREVMLRLARQRSWRLEQRLCSDSQH